MSTDEQMQPPIETPMDGRTGDPSPNHAPSEQTDEPDPSLGDRLASIEEQLQQLPKVLQVLEDLSRRVVRLEDNTMLTAEVYRYRQLRDWLEAGEWRKADEETIRVILDLTAAPDLDNLMPEQVAQMSCSELQVIDQLWQRYSNGRYGFGVQVRIYQEEGGDIETAIAQDQRVMVRLGRRVGWREGERWLQCDQLDYNGDAPEGCLPARWWNSPFGAKMTGYFFRRLMDCRI